MLELTAKNVYDTMIACMFQEGEDTSNHVPVKGIMHNYGFDPARLEANKEKIVELIGQLPPEFKQGMSFLNACYRADGVHWGEHRDMEALFVLGMAIKRVNLVVSREMWSAMPGGMPYYIVLPEPAGV